VSRPEPDPAFSDVDLNRAATEVYGRMTNPGDSPIGNQGPPHIPFIGPVIHRGQKPESHNSEDLWPTDSE